ncbi:MAG TPA: transglycosylase family protein [Acidimicrobiales bacterium]|nr:transglycosylase family protein [Acidimicrobiales bacterium]
MHAHVRPHETRGRAGGVAGLATRALVVTALVGGTAAYLHAGTDSASHRRAAEPYSAAALHEAAPYSGSATVTAYSASSDLATSQPSLAGEHLVARTLALASTSTRPANLVHVFHDGQATSLMTTANTVSGALAQADVTVGAHDLVRPGESATTRSGMNIHVVRVTYVVQHARVTVAHQVIRRADPKMAKGKTKLVRSGRNGIVAYTYRVVLHDGKVYRKTVLHRTTVRGALASIVRYGTKRTVRHRSVDSLNWHALAVCESGDNPRAVGGGGDYFGLYQFSVGTWHSVGGTGNPRDASRAEQTKRAKLLYQRRGTSPWPVCGSQLYT